jgi:hypothetical protein
MSSRMCISMVFHAAWLGIVICIGVVRRKLRTVCVTVFLEAVNCFVIKFNSTAQIISTVLYVSSQFLSTGGARPTGGIYQSTQWDVWTQK